MRNQIFKNTRELDLAANVSEDTLAAHKYIKLLGRRLLLLPGLRRLRRHAEKAISPAEPAGRITFQSSPLRKNKLQFEGLTILSTNMWHDWPRHRRLTERLEEISQMAESYGVDVLLLQEVTRTKDFHSDEWLSKRLGMAYVYSRANGHSKGIGFEEGLAIFSRYPIKGPRINQLSDGKNPFVRRLALGTTIFTPYGEIMTFSVHLGLTPSKNAEQQSRLHTWVDFEAGDKLALIGGDFNSNENSPQIRNTQSRWLDTFRSLYPHKDGITHEIRTPWGGILHRARLDYIFMRHGRTRWIVSETRHMKSILKPHSDHSAVLVHLRPEILPV